MPIPIRKLVNRLKSLSIARTSLKTLACGEANPQQISHGSH